MLEECLSQCPTFDFTRSGNRDSIPQIASELLYFHNAPVAHVVAYEDKLRNDRLTQKLTRFRAPHRWTPRFR